MSPVSFGTGWRGSEGFCAWCCALRRAFRMILMACKMTMNVPRAQAWGKVSSPGWSLAQSDAAWKTTNGGDTIIKRMNKNFFILPGGLRPSLDEQHSVHAPDHGQGRRLWVDGGLCASCVGSRCGSRREAVALDWEIRLVSLCACVGCPCQTRGRGWVWCVFARFGVSPGGR